MLRKVKTDQSKGELVFDQCSNSTQKHNKGTSFFSIPGLFAGFTAKGLSDCESVRSPTSPLDSRIFSCFGCSLWGQRTELDGFQSHRKSWCSEGIGLGIVGSLTDVKTDQAENFVGKSDSKNILFGSQLRINVPQRKGNQNHYLEKIVPPVTSPKSLPNYVFSAQSRTKSGLSHMGCHQLALEPNASPLEAEKANKRSCSSESAPNSAGFLSRSKTSLLCSALDVNTNTSASGLSMLNVGLHELSTTSSCSFNCALSASEIELSEDYTCVITHGPNPKTKHIYGDCILEENCMFEIPVSSKPEKMRSPVTSASFESFPVDDLLSICYTCQRKFVQGEDIYMYSGDKAFCSSECRTRGHYN